jgi:L-aminopeptidase/D-esterase-like protein
MTIDQAALVVGALAAEVVARAVVRAVTTAKGLPGFPSASDLAR